MALILPGSHYGRTTSRRDRRRPVSRGLPPCNRYTQGPGFQFRSINRDSYCRSCIRPTLLAGGAIIDRAGPPMLKMLQGHMMGDKRNRFVTATDHLAIRRSSGDHPNRCNCYEARTRWFSDQNAKNLQNNRVLSLKCQATIPHFFDPTSTFCASTHGKGVATFDSK